MGHSQTTAAENDSLWALTQLDSAQVGRLELTSVGEITLGADNSSSPQSVTRLVADGDGFDVVDGAKAEVLRYARDGTLRGRTGASAPAFAALRSPRALARVNDSLLVIGLDPKVGVVIVGPGSDGGRTIRTDVNASTFDIAVAGGTIALASIALDADLERGKASFLSLHDRTGRRIAPGCTPDPIYAASLARRGFFELFRAVGVSALDGKFYCRQPVSPVVQVYDSLGTRVSAIRLVPPFYIRGADAPQSMNQKAIDRFSASWTEHRQFFPHPDGFTSVYATLDTLSGNRQYHLFRCLELTTGAPRCAIGRTDLAPLDARGPDTLLVLLPAGGAGDRPRLGVLHIK